MCRRYICRWSRTCSCLTPSTPICCRMGFGEACFQCLPPTGHSVSTHGFLTRCLPLWPPKKPRVIPGQLKFANGKAKLGSLRGTSGGPAGTSHSARTSSSTAFTKQASRLGVQTKRAFLGGCPLSVPGPWKSPPPTSSTGISVVSLCQTLLTLLFELIMVQEAIAALKHLRGLKWQGPPGATCAQLGAVLPSQLQPLLGSNRHAACFQGAICLQLGMGVQAVCQSLVLANL